MTTPPQSEEDPVVGFLVKRFGPGLAADWGKGCPDDGVFVGLAEGRLFPGEREALEAHLRDCEHCRAIAERLPGGAKARSGRKVFRIPVPSWPGSARAGAGGKRLEVRPLAAAAVLLLAVAAGIGISRLFRKGGSSDGVLGTDRRLVAAAGDLARTRPQPFAGFSPLSKEERLATQPELRGSEPALLYPAG
ncbi:MAG TPA: zf-HC2 domain-containing protein, partial [Planctomycetota bacterium]|nr:zf-HC2 domain-containing protein [Planctomycetota bacterium]